VNRKGDGNMTREEFEKIIMSFEGIKSSQWEQIKSHIDNQFYSIQQESVLAVNKNALERKMSMMRLKSVDDKSKI